MGWMDLRREDDLICSARDSKETSIGKLCEGDNRYLVDTSQLRDSRPSASKLTYSSIRRLAALGR